MSNVATTSVLGYADAVMSGRVRTQRDRIFHCVVRSSQSIGRTRAEISALTDIRLSSVCGRVNELKTDEYVSELPYRKCAITHHSAKPVVISNEKSLISYLTMKKFDNDQLKLVIDNQLSFDQSGKDK